MTLIIGHRGAAGTYPENTMLSFQGAHQAGANGIELDVQMTKDGELVVIHDETVDRTTNGSGYVKDLTLKQLSHLDACYTFKQYSKKTPIPTLEEVLNWASQLQDSFVVNIEFKNGIIQYPHLEQKTIELIHKYNMQKSVIISSFNHYSLVTCKQIDAEIETAILYMEGLYKPWDYAKTVGAKGLHPHYYAVNSFILNEARLNSLDVRPFTVNDEEVMKNLVNDGCAAFITDFPEKAVNINKEE
ncbi:glycerophosphodiester phosphodiesterase [Metabacillus endolithicus]|uniref:Glycerophosphodiester phosphodiesterase n=1 Tax=Metabacillus endolithicus TaxID=1535204 RepID=A0ABW5BWS3_9BACI|nr:glycerophosphodiester phosphodiesterase [Metabacillus endolithicus]UPG64440.1 glycerophosphodiester phosphodiesterase [Metabacillus endolithicus]